MKTFLIGAGSALLLVAAVYAAFAVNAALQVREIRTYAEAATVAIASNWNEQALLQRASSELLATTDRQEIHDAFLKYRQLGRMISLSKGMGHIDVAYTTAGKKAVAVYIAKARFERRSVAIKLSLIKHKGGWQIMGFDVMPDRPPDRGTFSDDAAARIVTTGIAAVVCAGWSSLDTTLTRLTARHRKVILTGSGSASAGPEYGVSGDQRLGRFRPPAFVRPARLE